MVSIGSSPLFVALTQTASTLPFFLLALPAGAIGDIVNRRRLILFTEAWMLSVAIALVIITTGFGTFSWRDVANGETLDNQRGVTRDVADSRHSPGFQ